MDTDIHIRRLFLYALFRCITETYFCNGILPCPFACKDNFTLLHYTMGNSVAQTGIKAYIFFTISDTLEFIR